MPVSSKRTLIGRAGAVLAFACGVIGLVAGMTDHSWKLEPMGWFQGGTLMAALSLYALVDAAIAQHKPREHPTSSTRGSVAGRRRTPRPACLPPPLTALRGNAP